MGRGERIYSVTMNLRYLFVPKAILSGANRSWRGALLLTAFTALSCASAPQSAPPAKSQVKFGVEMARKNLWREALFRFESAERLRPSDPEILNNIAVAHEALGHFDLALEAYQKALDRAPSNTDLRHNYSRFTEFYQSFRPDDGATEDAEDSGQEDGG